MERFWKKIWDWLRYLFTGYLPGKMCPVCGKKELYLHGDNPIHPDGPPIFTYWTCGGCGAQSEYGFSPLMDEAAQKLGYKDAATLLEEAWNRRNMKE
jgi:hypothetical protein